MLLNMNFHYDIEHQFAQIFVQCFSFLDVNEKGIFFTKYVSSFYSKYAPLIIVWVSSKDRIITYVDIWLVCGLANHQVKVSERGGVGGRSGRGGVGGYKSIIFARVLDSLWSHNIFVTSHSKYGFFNAFFFSCVAVEILEDNSALRERLDGVSLPIVENYIVKSGSYG